jgi:4-carboxymuconolactone decarboxylase
LLRFARNDDEVNAPIALRAKSCSQCGTEQENPMSRVPDLAPADMTAEQKRLHDDIASKRRGNVRGPFAIWLRTPEIAEQANRFGNAIRVAGKLDKRLFELMVLIVARHWSAQYEWFAHEDQALENGLATAVVEAIRHGRRPDFARDDEALIYDVVSELNARKILSQAVYDRGVAHFGLELFIELVTAIGFYTLVAMMLNAFDAPVPGGGRPLP